MKNYIGLITSPYAGAGQIVELEETAQDSNLAHYLQSGILREATEEDITAAEETKANQEAAATYQAQQQAIADAADAPVVEIEPATMANTRAEINAYAVASGFTEEEAAAYPNKEELLDAVADWVANAPGNSITGSGVVDTATLEAGAPVTAADSAVPGSALPAEDVALEATNEAFVENGEQSR